MTAVILLEINLSTLIEVEVENFEQRCKNNGCKNRSVHMTH